MGVSERVRMERRKLAVGMKAETVRQLRAESAILSRDAYLRIYAKIASALQAMTGNVSNRPKGKKGKKGSNVTTSNGATEAENAFMREAEEAWLQDTTGELLTFERSQWFDSIFELADIWSRGVSCKDYANFIWRLLREILPNEADTWRSCSPIS